jgi:hypothetical protein
MNWSFKVFAASAISGALLVGSGCRQADWTDPEYIILQLQVGSVKALDSLSELPIEQQRAATPALIEAYNGGLQRDRVLEALVRIADPAAQDLLLEILNGNEDDRAAMAARALSAAQLTDTSVAIAQRLQRTADRRQYPVFLSAINQMPTPGAADVVAEIVMNRAERIGGIDTVKNGCKLMATIDNPSAASVRAMVYGLVNLIPDPYADAMQDCEAALLRHRDAAVAPLVEMLNDQNQEVINLMRELNMRNVGAQLRAAVVLSHIGSDAAADALRTWLSAAHPAPVDELRLMAVNEQQDWYSLSGQLFTFAATGIGHRHNAEDLAVLRRLESLETPGSLLNNYSTWFSLSSLAELGLRNAVYDQLARHGSPEDRTMLWERATTGATGRGGEGAAIELRSSILHFLGRNARPEEIELYAVVFNAQTPEAQGNFFVHRAYFALAEICSTNVECYAGMIDNQDQILLDEVFASYLAGITEQQQRDLEAGLLKKTAQIAAVWQLALRFADNPAAGAALLGAIGHTSLEVREAVSEAFLTMPALPAEFAATVGAFLEAERTNNNPRARDARHLLNVLRLTRTAP